MRHWWIAFIAGAAACSSSADGTVCTTLFASVITTALDASGQPISGWTIRDSVFRTHHAFSIVDQSLALYSPGAAVIFTDNYLDEVNESGDSVLVGGAATAKSFSATFIFANDGCHVRKVAGPDTVVAH